VAKERFISSLCPVFRKEVDAGREVKGKNAYIEKASIFPEIPSSILHRPHWAEPCHMTTPGWKEVQKCKYTLEHDLSALRKKRSLLYYLISSKG
jgi:hypothetical protein